MNNRVKRFQMYAGVDLVGSKMSMQESRNLTLEATSLGIKMCSKGTNRTVVIPYSNIKGFELYQEEKVEKSFSSEDAVTEAPKRRGRPPKDAE